MCGVCVGSSDSNCSIDRGVTLESEVGRVAIDQLQADGPGGTRRSRTERDFGAEVVALEFDVGAWLAAEVVPDTANSLSGRLGIETGVADGGAQANSEERWRQTPAILGQPDKLNDALEVVPGRGAE